MSTITISHKDQNVMVSTFSSGELEVMPYDYDLTNDEAIEVINSIKTKNDLSELEREFNQALKIVDELSVRIACCKYNGEKITIYKHDDLPF